FLYGVQVSSTPPALGQVLTATSATSADWQTVVFPQLPQTFTPTLAGSPPEYEYLTGYNAGTGLFTAAPVPSGGGGTPGSDSWQSLSGTYLGETQVVPWNGPTAGTPDTGLSRGAAGAVYVGDGTAGDFTGALKLTNLNFPDGTSFTSSKRFGSYVFTTDGTNVYATSQKAGFANYSGTDLTVVAGSVVSALSAVGGTLFFEEGVYPILSLVAETAAGFTNNYYAVGIP